VEATVECPGVQDPADEDPEPCRRAECGVVVRSGVLPFIITSVIVGIPVSGPVPYRREGSIFLCFLDVDLSPGFPSLSTLHLSNLLRFFRV